MEVGNGMDGEMEGVEVGKGMEWNGEMEGVEDGRRDRGVGEAAAVAFVCFREGVRQHACTQALTDAEHTAGRRGLGTRSTTGRRTLTPTAIAWWCGGVVVWWCGRCGYVCCS